MPKIGSLETGVYLTEVFRKAYGCGPLGPCIRGVQRQHPTDLLLTGSWTGLSGQAVCFVRYMCDEATVGYCLW
jgi:hypothetical protein